MPTPLSQKLKIKEGFSLLTINAPSAFRQEFAGLPEGVSISTKTRRYDQIHWFVTSSAQLQKDLDHVLSLLIDDVTCWIYFPKGSSKIQTDLTRDKGWNDLHNHKDLQWINLISFNDTWSAFGFRRKTAADKKKAAAPKTRPIFDYIDPAKKLVRLPDDFEKALKKSRKANEFLKTLSFTNKKEYVEWIVTAKREETRAERVTNSIERLEKGWKNPRNM